MAKRLVMGMDYNTLKRQAVAAGLSSLGSIAINYGLRKAKDAVTDYAMGYYRKYRRRPRGSLFRFRRARKYRRRPARARGRRTAIYARRSMAASRTIGFKTIRHRAELPTTHARTPDTNQAYKYFKLSDLAAAYPNTWKMYRYVRVKAVVYHFYVESSNVTIGTTHPMIYWAIKDTNEQHAENTLAAWAAHRNTHVHDFCFRNYMKINVRWPGITEAADGASDLFPRARAQWYNTDAAKLLTVEQKTIAYHLANYATGTESTVPNIKYTVSMILQFKGYIDQN